MNLRNLDTKEKQITKHLNPSSKYQFFTWLQYFNISPLLGYYTSLITVLTASFSQFQHVKNKTVAVLFPTKALSSYFLL